ncbi:hypothetical protein G6045_40170 [Streptomyces sp. YC504]|uniref:Uncharacterized protein n=1 Tax=Streptomyces mesophilus TaxID=1775132 RepID=A0A6G4XW31_9ACTN|nr:hypothetical protein [Streptomyces mesophilus]
MDGLPRQVMAEIQRLERTRSYLFPGAVVRAVLRWQEYAREPARRRWAYDSDADPHGECCGDPLYERERLAGVEQALSRRAARALRAVLAEADARWDR